MSVESRVCYCLRLEKSKARNVKKTGQRPKKPVAALPQSSVDDVTAPVVSSIYGWAMTSVERVTHVEHRPRPPAVTRIRSSPRNVTARQRAPVPRHCWREEPPKSDSLEEFCSRKVGLPEHTVNLARNKCNWVPCRPVKPLRTFRDKPDSCLPRRR